jgi:hypothetical protein
MCTSWRVEAVSDTSTVTLRVVEGDEREPGAWGYNWATMSLGDINTGTWSFRMGVGRRADGLAL